jgi:hypothetical protein
MLVTFAHAGKDLDAVKSKGFIQAGVGFFLLAGLVLGAGLDLVRANAIKVLIVLLYTPIALIVFILSVQKYTNQQPSCSHSLG